MRLYLVYLHMFTNQLISSGFSFSQLTESFRLVQLVRSVMNNRLAAWHERPQISPIHKPCVSTTESEKLGIGISLDLFKSDSYNICVTLAYNFNLKARSTEMGMPIR